MFDIIKYLKRSTPKLFKKQESSLQKRILGVKLVYSRFKSDYDKSYDLNTVSENRWLV